MSELEETEKLETPLTPTEPVVEGVKTLVNTEEPKPEEPRPEPVIVEPIASDALVIPEGLTVPDDIKTEFLEILNGEQSPLDRANALLSLQAKVMAQAQETDSTTWTTTQDEWQAEVKADPDVGGNNLQPALTNIGKLIDEYGTTELRNVFDLTGAGNNVHVIKFLNKIAGHLTEGGHEIGKPNTVVDSADAKASRMFPSMKG